jgi:pilus assembly protein FimV
MPSNPHSEKRPERSTSGGSFSLKTISAAVVSALVFSNAYAAGLGKLTVLSPLGQPLRAEIELTSVSKEEAGTLVAKLASPEAFRQANIDYSASLSTLQFAVEQRGDRQFVRVSSTQAVNEPFVDMLLELSGPNGRLVREYTFLLDPADLRGTQSAQVAPVPVQTPKAAQPATAARPSNAAAAPAPATEKAVPQAAERGAQSDQYRVRSGDTLAKIAGQVKPSGISLDQMLVALYRSNPDAFGGKNMNRLRAGQILSVPQGDAARGISAAEARRIVLAQAADFNSYRGKLAGQVAESTAQSSAAAKQGAGGKISATVEERSTPASEAKDKLKLSNVAPSPAGGASNEDLIAKEKALTEANARVKELERNVNELQQLLEVKNKSLAEQQKQVDAAKLAAAAAAATPPVAAAPAPTTTPAPVPAPAVPSAAEQTAKKPASEAPAVAAAPTKPAAAPKPAVVPPPPAPQPSFVESLLENPLVLPGLGALLVALGGLGIYRARRQKQSKQFEDSLISDSSLKANSLFGSTGGQSVDTNNSVFSSSFAPSASQLDSNEVDPVAEADVYIAYGRDAQAEEILKEALRTQPERHAVRVKLLEIYSNRKDLRAFEVLATELYGMTRGEGEEWAQAAAMGIAIDPDNPLYASGKGAPSTAGDTPTVLVAPTQPLDEQGLATLLADTQADTGALDADNPLEADSQYFGNTTAATDKPLEPVTDELPDLEPEAPAPAASMSSNDLDFDLEGMNLPDMTVPNTVPRPMPIEPPTELASIDFNFLDEPTPAQPEPASEPKLEENIAPAAQADSSELPPLDAPLQAEEVQIPEIQDIEFSLKDEAPLAEPQPELADINLEQKTPDIAPLEIDVPSLEDVSPTADAKLESATNDPLDFDLSGISLELNPPGGADTGFGLADIAAADESASAAAEMATKLDLAIAYQEIGDKEGARELLDEVMKGGTPEQSERAKNLLLELA